MSQPIKTVLTGLAVLVCLGCGSVFSAAETGIEFTGQVRIRTEGDKKSFSPDAGAEEFTQLRTRLALEAIVDQYTHLFIQLQDSRMFGGTDLNGNQNSATLNDAKNVDMHQAYLELDGLFGDRWGLQAGRFEVNLGGQRVFGSVGWHNVGRAWEGMNSWYQNDAVRATVYWLKQLEQYGSARGSDYDVFGLNTVLKETGAELFGFYERDANKDLIPRITNDIAALNRGSVGGYYKHVFGNVDLETNMVYQFGNQARVDTVISKLDISAYLVTGEIGYTLSSEKKVRLAAGLDLASGDDDPSDGTFKTYNNLYYTGHKYRGYMDYFLASNPAGLIDVMGRGSAEPAAGWTLKADVHYFQTAKNYTDFNNAKTSDVGAEIDLTITTTRLAAVKIDGGLSVFLPADSFAQRTDAEAGLWGYIMVTGNFRGN